MKKFLSIFSIALVAMFAMGCGNDEPTDGGKESLTFEITESAINSSSIEVMITPSDATVNYIADIVASAELEGKSDATIIDEWVSSGEHKTRKGVSFINKTGLNSNTSYTVVVFAITETEKVTRKAISTTEAVAPLPSDEFNVAINVKDITATSAVATATPNGSNRYYFRVITKMELDAFGIYNDNFQIFEYIIENPSSGDYITSGTTTLNCRLSPKMDYLAVAFNFENWEAVHNQEEDIQLFRYAFSTPEAPEVDPDTLFSYSNLVTTHTDFNLDVTPTLDQQWTYYIWTKKSYDETLATESKASIVMRSYFGLNNLAVEQGYGFGNIIQEDKLGRKGAATISAYQPLKNNTEYILVLFYVDPTTVDPTIVYDYNYVAVPFKTAEPTADAVATLSVSGPVIVKNGFKYDIQFLVKTDNNAIDLKVGAQLWNNYDFAKYWDPNDWSQIQAFFMFRTSVEPSTLEAAKTAEGATVSFPGVDKDDYVFFFEVLNAENTATQYAIRVQPELFDNVQ
ncbi:MAG: hypothetical protein J6U93_08390 [Alistipes sp.]|nr:hypothetical protein [Alistipes sp.]